MGSSATGAAMRDNALALLNSLDDQQRTRLSYELDDAERFNWFYTPTDHGGLAMVDMRSEQHRLVHRLLATGLSGAAYNTVATVMGLENVLDRNEDWGADFGRARGRDPLMYYVAIFGDPDDAAWSWRLGGHHVSVHFSLLDGEVVSAAPLFIGCNPATVPLLGPHPLRPLGGVEDLGRELLRSLSPEQHAVALVAPIAPPDLLTGNRAVLSEGDQAATLAEIMRGPHDESARSFLADFQARLEQDIGWTNELQRSMTFTREPHGLAVDRLDPDQRRNVRQLLDLFLNRLPGDLADQQAQLVSGPGLERLHFVWAGSAEPGEPHYYRLQNDRIVIEYDNAQNDADHVHTVWRDLESDFGGDALAAHYRHHHQDSP